MSSDERSAPEEGVEAAIERLERELLALRRRLRPEPAPLPAEPFEVLAVCPGEGWYALPIAAIREVIAMVECEPLPEAPAWVLGTFHYGDEAVPMIDLRCRLEGRSSEPDPAMTAVIVTAGAAASRLSALAVREVGDLLTVEPAHVAPAVDLPQASFLLGSFVGLDRDLRLLSVDRLCDVLPPDGAPSPASCEPAL